jgi:Type IV secretion-system coupling protein DNA-binding domain
MNWEIVLPLVGSTALLGLLGLMNFKAPESELRELLLPAEMTAEQATAIMRHIAAVREPLTLRTVSADGRVRFFVAASTSALASLAAAIGGIVPEARIEEAGALAASPVKAVAAARVWWDGPWPMLKDDEPQLTTAGLLGVLASTRGRETIELHIRTSPTGRINRPAASSERGRTPANPWLMRLFWPAQPPREEVRLIRAKYSGLLLRTEVLVVAKAGSMEGAATAAQRVIAALRTAGGMRGVLRYRTLSGSRAGRAVTRRRLPHAWEPSTLLSPEEIVGVSALPIEGPTIPGVNLGVAPRMAPPINLPKRGRTFALSNFPATASRPLAQPVEGGLLHAAIVGATGSGKSTMLTSLISADIKAGRGAFVLDLKGDLIESCLAQVPANRVQDVVVLEPARGGAQPGLKLFPKGGDPELTADLVLGTLQQLYSDSWGIRSSQYLGLALKTLAALPDATLVDLPALFGDPAFQRRALARVTDPWLKAEWKRFLALSPAEAATHLSSPLTKISELVNRGRLRLVLGQTESKLDFRDVLAKGKIVLISLPPGLLGMPATRLLAAMLLWQCFQAIEGRAALPPDKRSPFFMYLDEVAVLGDLPVPLEAIFERARSHGAGIVIAPQALSQLSRDVRASLLANVGTLVTFAQRSEEEARVLSRHLPGVSVSQLQHLGQFEVAMRLALGPGSVTPTMTGTTLTPEQPVSDPGEIRTAAAERWGQTLEHIDEALARRNGQEAKHEPTQVSPGAKSEPKPFGVRRRG